MSNEIPLLVHINYGSLLLEHIVYLFRIYLSIQSVKKRRPSTTKKTQICHNCCETLKNHVWYTKMLEFQLYWRRGVSFPNFYQKINPIFNFHQKYPFIFQDPGDSHSKNPEDLQAPPPPPCVLSRCLQIIEESGMSRYK